MKVITDTVVRGKVDLPPEALVEGPPVAILAPGAEAPIQLTAAEESELEAAVNELRDGRFVDGEDFLNELRSQRPKAQAWYPRQKCL
jgi:hypothetical protein